MNNLKRLLYYGETVRPIAETEFEGYFVTNLGRVFSSKKQVNYITLNGIEYNCIVWKELKPFYTHQYKTVTLVSKGKKRKNVYIHKLIYESFIGKFDTHYFKIVYKDKDTENCTLDNLKLDFRNKSRANLLKYTKQKHLLEALEDHTRATGTI